MLELPNPRVLVCGSRDWSDPQLIHDILDQLSARYEQRLVVIEGAARGADHAAHTWSQANQLPPDRHRCHPVDWDAARRDHPNDAWRAGHDRNTRMLAENPRLILAFHQHLHPRLANGGTADTVLKARLLDLPVFHIRARDPRAQPGVLRVDGRWARQLPDVPAHRLTRARSDLQAAGLTPRITRPPSRPPNPTAARRHRPRR